MRVPVRRESDVGYKKFMTWQRSATPAVGIPDDEQPTVVPGDEITAIGTEAKRLKIFEVAEMMQSVEILSAKNRELALASCGGSRGAVGRKSSLPQIMAASRVSFPCFRFLGTSARARCGR